MGLRQKKERQRDNLPLPTLCFFLPLRSSLPFLLLSLYPLQPFCFKIVLSLWSPDEVSSSSLLFFFTLDFSVWAFRMLITWAWVFLPSSPQKHAVHPLKHGCKLYIVDIFFSQFFYLFVNLGWFQFTVWQGKLELGKANMGVCNNSCRWCGYRKIFKKTLCCAGTATAEIAGFLWETRGKQTHTRLQVAFLSFVQS